jgi:UDP-N-acetylglucosamine acyltransferase
VNVVGMRRAGMSSVDVEAVRHAFHVLYRQSQPISLSLLQLEQELGHNPAVAEMLTFIHNSRRGINLCVDHDERGEAA